MLDPKDSEWIISHSLMVIVEEARRRGVDYAPILQDCGLSEQNCANPDLKINAKSMFAIFERMAARLEDDAFVFDLFYNRPVGFASVLDYVFLCASTLEEGLRNLERFFHLRTNVINLTFRKTSADGILELEVPHHFGPCSQFTFSSLAFWIGRISKAVELDPAPVRAQVACKPPRSSSPLLMKLGKKIEFNAQHTRIFIPVHYLAKNSATADQNLYRIVEKTALAALNDDSLLTSQTHRIAAKISQGLRSGNCSIDYVSDALGLSPRSLQRQLEREGTNYRRILDEVRRSVAERYLVDTDLPVKDIAYLLGFSEISAFSRAVRNWFGHPPRNIRQGVLNGP